MKKPKKEDFHYTTKETEGVVTHVHDFQVVANYSRAQDKYIDKQIDWNLENRIQV